MAALHEALQCLGPIPWDTVPTKSPDELRAYVTDIFEKGRFIVETVPEPPSPILPRSDANASSSRDSSRSRLSAADLPSLRKQWGKPIKIGNAKENPLAIDMYKLGGKDGKGAWFARRSIHEGLPFSRWKAKMQVEMEETLKARQEQISRGQIPETSIRGIGGDELLEKIDIRDPDQDRLLGRIAVYQLSAQFPGPTTPRDFVTLIITTDRASDDDQEPPSYMVVSKPCDHPDAPPREGYIRGQYESIEFIREVPVESRMNKPKHQERPVPPRTTSFPANLSNEGNTRSDTQLQDFASDKSDAAQSAPTGRKRGKTDTAVREQQEQTDDGDSINPVEWIMITRSDPGGSVPRWMVERGTPKSIAVDAAKFVAWASQPDQPSDEAPAETGAVVQNVNSERRESIGSLQMNGRLAGIEGTDMENKDLDAAETYDERAKQLDDDSSEDENGGQESGLWSSVTGMINSGLQSYAPRAVLDYIPGHSPQPSLTEPRTITVPIIVKQESAHQSPDTGDTASLSSIDTFTSADSSMHAPVPSSPGQGPSQSVSSASLGGSSVGLNHNIEGFAGPRVIDQQKPSKPTSHEKELAKLASRKRDIEAKLMSIRSETESLGQHHPPGAKKEDDTESRAESDDRASTSSSVGKINQDNTAPQDPPISEQDQQKRIARLSRDESKLLSQLRKLQAQQMKVAHKLESRQRKEAQRREKKEKEKEKAQRSQNKEVDDLRKQVEDLKGQVRELREEREKWLDLVGRLQKENTKLAAEKGGAADGGLPLGKEG